MAEWPSIRESDLFAGYTMNKPLPQMGMVFDLETKRHHKLRAALGIDEKIAHLDDLEVDDLIRVADREGIKLGNRKTRESVYKKLVEDIDKVVTKAAVKLYGCEITAIGCANVAGGKVRALAVGDDVGAVGKTEEEVIRAFLKLLEEEGPVCLMGFNIRNFDIPVLRTRCMMLEILWPQWIPQTRSEDKYEKVYVFDAQDTLDEGNLDTWLRMAGLPPKTGKGADAPSMNSAEVAQYVADDVERERMLIRRILPNVHAHHDLMEREVVEA